MSRHGVPNPELAEIVRRDVFGDSTPEEAADLRSDAMAERWYVELVRVADSLSAQLNNHAAGAGSRDEKWRRSASFLRSKYVDTIAEARVVIADLRDRMRDGNVHALNGEIARLRGAIRVHQIASTDAEEWDLELWATVARPGN